LTTLEPGQRFAGRYEIVRCIARGGMGAVYEVVHTETQRRRALKVLLASELEETDARARFQREARITAAVESEFLVEVFDAGVDEASGMPFLVMELLRGDDLGRLVKKHGALDPGDVVTFLWQVAVALDKTHEARIVHRDLKPENLFLTLRDDGSPRVKILDFGISKKIDAKASSGTTRSIGTPLYMAPEQFEARGISPATDIYALGMIAYTLLVGVAYWEEEASASESVLAFARVVAEGASEPASARAARQNKLLPGAFDRWFKRAAARSGKDRFTKATEAIAALADALALGTSDTVRAISRTQQMGTRDVDDLLAGLRDTRVAAATPEVSRGRSIWPAFVAIFLGMTAVVLAVVRKPDVLVTARPSGKIHVSVFVAAPPPPPAMSTELPHVVDAAAPVALSRRPQPVRAAPSASASASASAAPSASTIYTRD
jgi:serine/threonine-protein kinase